MRNYFRASAGHMRPRVKGHGPSEIGWLPPAANLEVLQPGMATRTRAHNTGLVAEAAE